jgi:hypothetical protein
MNRFVILHHVLDDGQPWNRQSASESGRSLTRGSHWDWMFEWPTGLLTWSTPVLDDFRLRPTWIVNATRLPDHRAAYLEYEGPVSRNRGHVNRQWFGTFRNVEQLGPNELRLHFPKVKIVTPSSHRMTFEMAFAGTDWNAIADFDVKGGTLRFAWTAG